MVKQAGVAAWLIGIAAVIAIMTWSGLDAVGHAVASVGWESSSWWWCAAS